MELSVRQLAGWRVACEGRSQSALLLLATLRAGAMQGVQLLLVLLGLLLVPRPQLPGAAHTHQRL
jgi:hypothetical protein